MSNQKMFFTYEKARNEPGFAPRSGMEAPPAAMNRFQSHKTNRWLESIRHDPR